MKYHKTVADYFAAQNEWSEALELLRGAVTATELEETIKWGAPAYVLDGKIVIGMAAFKQYVGLWFHQGALLKDEASKLVNAQEGKTKALRQWRFASLEEIHDNMNTLKAYIDEAITNQKAGKEIKADRNKELIVPDLLQEKLDQDANLKESFDSFSLSRQREFTEHIDEAKREETKLKRLEKIIPMIQDGVGLNDKYRK
ncbi:MAG: YdeI/OmpD-associated family protein [Bacteroidota bacterium]